MPSKRSPLGQKYRRQQKKAADTRKAIMISGGILGLVAAIGITAWAIAPDPIDEATGCPIGDRAPVAHTIVLIDETDSLSRSELAYARSLIHTEYFWLPQGGRLTVRNIVADPDEARDITVCRMRDGSSALGLTVNKDFLQKTFDRLAGAQLAALIEALAHAPPQQASPILESASEVVNRPDFGRNVESRRLVIHSDFAQHSDLVSQYGRGPTRLSEDVAGQLAPDMGAVQVRLHYIPRRSLGAIQGARHRAFWKQYFEDAGAEVSLGHDLLIGEAPHRATWVMSNTTPAPGARP